jgi:hypothetical protein
MDLIESLTADFDQLRDLTIDLTIMPKLQREWIFRALVRLQDVSWKAQTAALTTMGDRVSPIEFAKRKILERSDVMEDIAISIQQTHRIESRESKMDLYSDLVLQTITDCEREILPYLYESVSEADRRRMGVTYRKYKDIALDHGFYQPQAV